MENTEENQIIAKEDNKLTYLKNFLIIYGIWIVLNIIIFLICYHSQLKETFLQAIGCILAAPFAFIIVFSPAIIISWLLFKKIINPYWRCVLVSLLIPLNNVIYYIIEYKLNIPFTFTQAPVNYTIIIGICSLCWILPMTFITLLSTPKEILKCKWYAVLTVVLIFILGWIIAYYTLLLPLTYL